MAAPAWQQAEARLRIRALFADHRALFRREILGQIDEEDDDVAPGQLDPAIVDRVSLARASEAPDPMDCEEAAESEI